ncbi:MAG: protein S100 [Steroidobacteraceae bacterium]|nr:protein S100 [Steroidobacteraceae bacterium]
MNDVPLHRLYRHFSELPYSLRALYTAVLVILGIGYLFALVYLFHTYSGRDGNPGSLSYEDLVIAYTGSGEASRLESALRGPMSTMLPRHELDRVVDWVRQGSDREDYEAEIRAVLNERCMSCHDGSNPHLSNLSGYDNVMKVTEQDTGADIFTLVRVSHIHLFGISFIFFIVGLIFSHAYVRPVWFKVLVTTLPFVAVMTDVSSWYFTKLYQPFAWVVMAAGATMGLCFAFMWVVSMYQMWISPTPAKVRERAAKDGYGVG